MASGRNVSMNVELGNNDFVSDNMAVGANDNQQVFYFDDHSGECAVLVDTSRVDSANKRMRNGLFLVFFGLKGIIKDIKAIGFTLYKFFLTI